MLGFSVVLLQFFPESQNTKEHKSKKDFIKKKKEVGRGERRRKINAVLHPDSLGPLQLKVHSCNNEHFIKALF